MHLSLFAAHPNPEPKQLIRCLTISYQRISANKTVFPFRQYFLTGRLCKQKIPEIAILFQPAAIENRTIKKKCAEKKPRIKWGLCV
jgi:hypothetical protein